MANMEEQKANDLIESFYQAVRAEALDPCEALNAGFHTSAIQTIGGMLFHYLVHGKEMPPNPDAPNKP